MSQPATVPLGPSRQAMSLRPSMLKSWAAVTELPIFAVHTPRPWVAAASMPVPLLKTRSSTGQSGIEWAPGHAAIMRAVHPEIGADQDFGGRGARIEHDGVDRNIIAIALR